MSCGVYNTNIDKSLHYDKLRDSSHSILKRKYLDNKTEIIPLDNIPTQIKSSTLFDVITLLRNAEYNDAMGILLKKDGNDFIGIDSGSYYGCCVHFNNETIDYNSIKLSHSGDSKPELYSGYGGHVIENNNTFLHHRLLVETDDKIINVHNLDIPIDKTIKLSSCSNSWDKVYYQFIIIANKLYKDLELECDYIVLVAQVTYIINKSLKDLSTSTDGSDNFEPSCSMLLTTKDNTKVNVVYPWDDDSNMTIWSMITIKNNTIE